MRQESKQTVSRKLLVDIGNTNLKWCWLEGASLSDIQSISHQQGKLSDISTICWAGAKRPEAVFVANVATPALDQKIDLWMRDNWSIAPCFLVSKVESFGVRNAYINPKQLGVDRWLTLVAVHNQYTVPACIVDCGTAITIDLLMEDGQHLGGLILPGFELMRGALLEKTHIPRVQPVQATTDILGKDTESAVASACLNSAAALVERVLKMVAEKSGKSPVVFITGSDAALLQSVLTVPVQLQQDLVMLGLSVVAAGRN